MNFKIDTKEKMHVITLLDEVVPANMTEELVSQFNSYLNDPVKNLVVNLAKVKEMDASVAESLADIQQSFYEKNVSLVYCQLTKPVELFLEQQELLEVMNVTPTESEACDIVQMEEIEREFL